MEKQLRMCHLYGNLMNTYGDIGNILVMNYYCKKMGIATSYDLLSLEDNFDPEAYDFVLFGGGQDFEQQVISKDLYTKKAGLTQYIEGEGVFLGVCGGFQLLGQYYVDAAGNEIPGLGILSHYTRGQQAGEERLIGNVKIYSERFDEEYIGFENHGGRTFLGAEEAALGKVLAGDGNNGEDGTEGVMYKNTFGTYFHGPILARNEHLAVHFINLCMQQRYGSAYTEIPFSEI